MRNIAKVSYNRRTQFKAEQREAIEKINKGRDFEIELAGEKSVSLAETAIVIELEKRKREADEFINL